MNTIEERLRDALAERAAHSPIDPDAWERTRARSRTGLRPTGWRWSRRGQVLIPAAAAVAVLAIIIGVTAAVNGVTARSAGKPADARSTNPAPAATKGPSGPFLIDDDPPVSALLAFPVKAPATGRTAVAYAWLAYTSPYVWEDQAQGLQSCTDVQYPSGSAAGDCAPLPRLGANVPARVTDSKYMGASSGPLVLQGLAVNQVVSVAAVLPDGQVIAGMVKTGRGFPDKAWAVVTPADEATYEPVSGIQLVFRDASGAEVATLSTAAPKGPPQVAQPASGGIVAFTPPKNRSDDSSVKAYLIDGYVGFFWPRPLKAAGWMAPQPAAGPPALSGLMAPFISNKSQVWEAFGYAHADVARVVLRLGGGGQVSAPTFAAWPGSGLRLWAIRLPAPVEYDSNGFPVLTATGYDAAGQAVAHVKLGRGLG